MTSKRFSFFIFTFLIFFSFSISAQCDSSQLEFKNAYSTRHLGAQNLDIDIEKCVIKNNGRISMSGIMIDRGDKTPLHYGVYSRVKKNENDSYETKEELGITGEDGRFEIKTKLNSQEMIMFSYVGYNTRVLIININD